MKNLKRIPSVQQLCMICLLSLLWVSSEAFAACADGPAAVTMACETNPSNTSADQATVSSASGSDSIHNMSGDFVTLLEESAQTATSSANSCRSAGSTCAAECAAEAKAILDTLEDCSSGDDEESDDGCEARNAAKEAAAAKLNAIGAQCSSDAGSAADQLDQAAAKLTADAAVARKSFQASKGVPGNQSSSSGSLSSGGGGDGKVDPSKYSDSQCMRADDGFKHQDCTARYIKNCKDRLGDARCQKFATHYCEPPKADAKKDTGEKVAATKKASSKDKKDDEEEEEEEEKTVEDYYREPSEGYGSNFCHFAVATQFCAGGDRGACVSCENLSLIKTCNEKDIVKCLPTMTDLDKQKAVAICPTDPIFVHLNKSAAGENQTADENNTEGPKEQEFVGDGKTTVQSNMNITDIRPEVGPPLFNAHSSIIQNKCQQHELNNCEPTK